MKKLDLIHTTVLIVAIFAGYAALQYFISFLSSLAYVLEVYYMDTQLIERFLYNLILIASFSAVCILLIKNGRRYTTTLLKYDPEMDWDNEILWQLDRKTMIFVVFIGIGLYMLVHSIPYTISYFIDLFRSKVGGEPGKEATARSGFIIQLLQVSLSIFLIYSAPTLTNFIEK